MSSGYYDPEEREEILRELAHQLRNQRFFVGNDNPAINIVNDDIRVANNSTIRVADREEALRAPIMAPMSFTTDDAGLLTTEAVDRVVQNINREIGEVAFAPVFHEDRQSEEIHSRHLNHRLLKEAKQRRAEKAKHDTIEG